MNKPKRTRKPKQDRYTVYGTGQMDEAELCTVNTEGLTNIIMAALAPIYTNLRAEKCK